MAAFNKNGFGKNIPKAKRPSRTPNTIEKPDEKTPEMIKLEKRRAAQKKMVLNNVKNVSMKNRR